MSGRRGDGGGYAMPPGIPGAVPTRVVAVDAPRAFGFDARSRAPRLSMGLRIEAPDPATAGDYRQTALEHESPEPRTLSFQAGPGDLFVVQMTQRIDGATIDLGTLLITERGFAYPVPAGYVLVQAGCIQKNPANPFAVLNSSVGFGIPRPVEAGFAYDVDNASLTVIPVPNFAAQVRITAPLGETVSMVIQGVTYQTLPGVPIVLPVNFLTQIEVQTTVAPTKVAIMWTIYR